MKYSCSRNSYVSIPPDTVPRMMAKKEVAVSLAYILWIVVVVLVVLWLLGFLVAHISSGLIHLLLLIALIVILLLRPVV